jgi:hypothetical protein
MIFVRIKTCCSTVGGGASSGLHALDDGMIEITRLLAALPVDSVIMVTNLLGNPLAPAGARGAALEFIAKRHA